MVTAACPEDASRLQTSFQYRQLTLPLFSFFNLIRFKHHLKIALGKDISQFRSVSVTPRKN
jgi:hypothetical protein